MKKIIGGLVMITLISVLSGCGLKKSSVNNHIVGFGAGSCRTAVHAVRRSG